MKPSPYGDSYMMVGQSVKFEPSWANRSVEKKITILTEPSTAASETKSKL